MEESCVEWFRSILVIEQLMKKKGKIDALNSFDHSFSLEKAQHPTPGIVMFRRHCHIAPGGLYGWKRVVCNDLG